MYYKLDENKNVIPSSLEEWSNFIENKLPSNYWIVDQETVDGYRVSTVFIGLCHNFDPYSKVPIVFETMIFDHDDKSVYQRRYSTWNEAEEGHKEAVKWANNSNKEE